jgi:endonuclease/exonuclease/phosphatase family metal-dependent hydrolase
MSFNIRYGTADDGENSWQHRKMLVRNVIDGFNPDLVGLQEALDFQLDELEADLSEYAHVGVGRDDGVTAGEHAAILYRSSRFDLIEHGTFWFSDTPEVPGSTSWGNHVTRICTWARLLDKESGITFYLYNVHLDHQSQVSRERSVELLAARLSQRVTLDPLIVAGDFNAGEENSALRYLLGRSERASEGTLAVTASPELVDAFRVVHPTATDVGTFNSFRGVTSGDKIDAILLSPSWTVLDAAILHISFDGKYPSDHFPVTAVLTSNR